MRISSRRLGEFLVSRRVLSRDALEELLARARAESVELSELLTVEGAVSAQDLVAALASELGFPFVDLDDHTILADAWGLVPEDLARGYLAVALERRPDGVVVALEDPGDDQVIAAQADDLGTEVLPVVAARDDLGRLIEQMYRPATDGPSGEPRGQQGWADASVSPSAA
jgi:type IV pilus assembly protein PilB